MDAPVTRTDDGMAFLVDVLVVSHGYVSCFEIKWPFTSTYFITLSNMCRCFVLLFLLGLPVPMQK